VANSSLEAQHAPLVAEVCDGCSPVAKWLTYHRSDGQQSSDVRIAILEYANSMGWPEWWNDGGWKQARAVPALEIVVESGAEERRQLVKRIQDLSSTAITHVVGHIPDSLLPHRARAVLLESLLGRRILMGDMPL